MNHNATKSVSQEFLSLEKNLNKGGTLEKIGDRIRRIREFKLLTQKELGHKLKCSGSYIGKIERGDFPDSKVKVLTYLQILKKITPALDVTIADLLKGVWETS